MKRSAVTPLPPDLGAEIPGATARDSPYYQGLWLGRKQGQDTECELWRVPGRGKWPELTYWVAGDAIMHIGGIRRMPRKPDIRAQHERICLAGWSAVRDAMEHAGMTPVAAGTGTRNTARRVTGLRERIWQAAHAIAQSCAASAGSEEFFDEPPIVERAWKASGAVQEWLRSLSSSALIAIGVAAVARVRDWYQDDSRPIQWYLAQFATLNPFSGGLELRPVDGKKSRSCTDVLSEGWLHPDSSVTTWAREYHARKSREPWLRPLELTA